MGPMYTWQKLYEAVSSLVGSGSISERLEAAAMYLIVLDDKDFPDQPLRLKYREIRERLTRDGSIPTTVNALSEEESSTTATDILSLFNEVAAKYDNPFK